MADITQAEATGAITDLLMTIILIPFLIYLFKADNENPFRKYWVRFILYLTASSFLGFIAHYFCKDIIFKLVWIPLYILLFSTVNAFLMLALNSCDKDTKKAKKITFIATVIVYIFVEYIELAMNKNAIRMYTLYAVVLTFIGFGFYIYNAVKNRNKASVMLLLTFPPLCIAGFFQMCRNILIHIVWDFNEDGITHILIILAIGVMFAAARIDLKVKKTTKTP